MDNLDLWNKWKVPPSTALKPITAGRLKGKSDINPQWRIQALTQEFGPCGQGWKYTIDKLWTELGGNEEVAAFALVSVWYKVDDVWSEPVQGIGGSMLITKEKNGLYTSDEAYKMAVTDALSVALKALGVAADVYLGLFDSKYSKGPSNQGNGNSGNNQKRPPPQQSKPEDEEAAKKKGIVAIQTKAVELAISNNDLAAYVKHLMKVDSLSKLTSAQLRVVYQNLKLGSVADWLMSAQQGKAA